MPLLMKMNVVGEADNKLNEKNIDSTENDLDDDLDIPWSVEQSDREVDDRRSDEVESQVAIDFGNDWHLRRKVYKLH